MGHNVSKKLKDVHLQPDNMTGKHPPWFAGPGAQLQKTEAVKVHTAATRHVAPSKSSPNSENGAKVSAVGGAKSKEGGKKSKEILAKSKDSGTKSKAKTSPSSSSSSSSSRQSASSETGAPKKYPKDTKNDNLKFYRGEISSLQWYNGFGGKKIDDMLRWKGNYTELERNHRYIQWLFPIPEGSGMNPHAQSLQEHEAEAIMLDTTLSDKVLKAYKMMLDFYGMKLVCETTGQISRSANWVERYKHLNKSVHNRLRISRIVKSLGYLGFKHLQVPFVRGIIYEAVSSRELRALDCSSLPHWIEAISEEVGREYMWKYYCELKGYASDVPREIAPEPEADYLSETGSDVDGVAIASDVAGVPTVGDAHAGTAV